ncbi:MAG: helical backbone metal receptor [Methanomassiliicoccales archaeon]
MEKKSMMLAAILVVAVVIGAGLWVVLSSNDDNESATLIDSLGRKVTIEEAPKTIVSVSPALTEMVYAIGEGECLIGVTSFCDYPPELTDGLESGDIVTIGGYNEEIDEDLIISLDPDVVFLEASVAEHISLVIKLEQANIDAVVMYEASNSSMVYDNIEMMGKALYEETNASALVTMMGSKFDDVATEIDGIDGTPSVMLVIYWGKASIWVAGDGSFADEIIERAGAVNAFDDKVSWASVGAEDIVAADPDIIILAAMSMGDVSYAIDELEDNPIYTDINATVYTILGQADNAILRQSERIVEATYICAMMAHPEEFEATLPKDLGDNYTDYLPSEWAS